MKLARFMSEGRLHRNLGRLKFKINDRHPVFFDRIQNPAYRFAVFSVNSSSEFSNSK